jgi:hypothetical protein
MTCSVLCRYRHNTHSAHTVTNPVPPQALAVTRASATIRAARRAELVGPRRNRVATTTGAEIGVDTIASNAFKALTPLYPLGRRQPNG